MPRISSSLSKQDRLGAVKVRWGIDRMRYTVEPGLYALGTPDEKSPVLVTANYKLSFDQLRSALPDRNLWILVLDTKGVNVWCSAGKGTFGTEELVRRMEWSGLARRVSHRLLILPQLAAPGVAAHEVKRRTGFRVIYGPIRASDIPRFLDQGLQATPEMRKKTFGLRERIVLIPIELVAALKWGLILFLALSLIRFIIQPGEGWMGALERNLRSLAAILTAILSGAVLTPVLLPWLPGRAFSAKGGILGFLAAIGLTWSWAEGSLTAAEGLERLAWFFLVPALSAFLAMNFTGASTFTSLSGVKKEMRWAVPLQVAAGALGLLSWLGAQFL